MDEDMDMVSAYTERMRVAGSRLACGGCVLDSTLVALRLIHLRKSIASLRFEVRTVWLKALLATHHDRFHVRGKMQDPRPVDDRQYLELIGL